MNTNFSVRYHYERDVAIVDATGRLVHGEANYELRELIAGFLGHGYLRILVNLAGVTYVDSSALGAFIAAQRDAQSSGGALKLANAGRRMGNILQLTKLCIVFAVYPSEDAALASFGIAKEPQPWSTYNLHRVA